MNRLLQFIAGLCFLGAVGATAFGIFGTGLQSRTFEGQRALPVAAPAPVQAPTEVPTAPEATPPPATPTPEPRLSDGEINELLATLADDAERWAAGAEVGLAVRLDGQLHVGGLDESVLSASSTKPVWIAAAVIAGVRIEELAEPIMQYSDNELTGVLLAETGVDAVNEFTAALELSETRLSGWPFGDDRLRASDFGSAGTVNLTSGTDLTAFWSLLANDRVDGIDGPALLELFTITPDANTSVSPYGGALTHRLPATVAATTAHKAGWLPPDCCETDDRVIITAGSIPLRIGESERYSVALWVRNGSSYAGGVEWVGWAACEIHALVDDEPLTCGRPDDPELPESDPVEEPEA